MAALTTATRLAARSVHIKIYPMARTLPERREVLRVLQRFGDVEVFMCLKVSPPYSLPASSLLCFGPYMFFLSDTPPPLM
jgi:hypothetical protein